MKFIPETIGDRVLVWVKENYGTQTKAAEALGISKTFLNFVVNGRRSPTPKILDAMGLESRVVYVEKGSE